jgi:hypothetical protein
MSQARRDDFVERLQRQQPEGLDEFCRQMNVAQEALRSWLAHDLQTNVRPHETAIAAAFALKAFEFLKPVDHQQIVEFQIAMQSSLEAAARNKDLSEANIAFSQHRYDRVVELLCPHEDCLDDLTRRKLAFAKRLLHTARTVILGDGRECFGKLQYGDRARRLSAMRDTRECRNRSEVWGYVSVRHVEYWRQSPLGFGPTGRERRTPPERKHGW